MENIIEIPALIDMHAHFREPGFEYKETILTGLKSAQKGGFGTVCLMPNTNPVCDNPEILKFILKKAEQVPNVRVLPIAAVTKNLKSEDLIDFQKLKKAGAIAFSNDGLPILNKKIFKKALQSGELIISHCEDETKEVEWQIEIFKEVLKEGKVAPRLHFAHISKKNSIDIIRREKPFCPNLTAETCPHYFTFTAENHTLTGVFKMNPPLGDKNDQKAVIEAVLDSTIDVISTDHAPHAKQEKLLPFNEAPNGITGLETAFSLSFMTFGLDVVIEKMAKKPCEILRIENKAKIKVALDETWIANAKDFETKCKISPYENIKLRGKVYGK